MRIAIPVMSENGMETEVSGHFGHAPYFAFIDVEDGEVKKIEFDKNPFEEHTPGTVPTYIHQKGAETIVVNGMGERAVNVFNHFGIKVYTGFVGTVGDVVSQYTAGTLASRESDIEHHHHHH